MPVTQRIVLSSDGAESAALPSILRIEPYLMDVNNNCWYAFKSNRLAIIRFSMGEMLAGHLVTIT